MLKTRIIPCLDVIKNKVVKGVNFKNIDDVLNLKDSLIKKLYIALDIKDNQIVSHGWQQTNKQ